MNFEVDTQQMTAFKMVKRRDKTVEKAFTDNFKIVCKKFRFLNLQRGNAIIGP